MKQRYPNTFIGINGGIKTLDAAAAHLAHVDGVMVGRAAYQDTSMLAGVDQCIRRGAETGVDWIALRDRMMSYAAAHIETGGRLQQVTRHMVGLFLGMPGARRFRQILSSDAAKPGAGPEVIEAAFAAIDFSPAGSEAISA